MGIADIVLIVFIVLKLLGLISTSWWMIFLPYVGVVVLLYITVKIWEWNE